MYIHSTTYTHTHAHTHAHTQSPEKDSNVLSQI